MVRMARSERTKGVTEQEQQIALCEWAGWKRNVIYDTKSRELISWLDPSGKLVFGHLPDTNSLDVLHEMEKKLTLEQNETWLIELYVICELGGFPILNCPNCHLTRQGACILIKSTASDRREALLKTLGLWKE